MAFEIPKLSIDTGTPRSVPGHIVSGALAAGVAAGAINYNRYAKGEIAKCEAINDSIKLSIQGGIATGSAIAAANYVGQNKYLNMISAVSIGLSGIYLVEKLAENLQKGRPEMIEEALGEEIESEEE